MVSYTSTVCGGGFVLSKGRRPMCDIVSLSLPGPIAPMFAHLVEVLEEIQNTAGDLLLVEAGASSVASDGSDAAHRRNSPGGGERSRDGAAEGRSRV